LKALVRAQRGPVLTAPLPALKSKLPATRMLTVTSTAALPALV
jgi:hypothetical protein